MNQKRFSTLKQAGRYVALTWYGRWGTRKCAGRICRGGMPEDAMLLQENVIWWEMAWRL